MKIFITGVAGFLGSHLADLMIANGHTVAGNDNMIGGYVDNVPQDVEFHQVDCKDLDKLTKAITPLLHNTSSRKNMLLGYDQVRRTLGIPGVYDRAAQDILKRLKL